MIKLKKRKDKSKRERDLVGEKSRCYCVELQKRQAAGEESKGCLISFKGFDFEIIVLNFIKVKLLIYIYIYI